MAELNNATVPLAQPRNRRGDLLATLAIVGLLMTLLLLFMGPPIPPGNRDLLMVSLGALLAIVKDVYGFEFGASKNSERNVQLAADVLNGAAPPHR